MGKEQCLSYCIKGIAGRKATGGKKKKRGKAETGMATANFQH